jgi:hypothetical protein
MLISAAPLFAGISIFCLTMRHDMVITNFFGGLMANEGLGTLAISLDWTQICMCASTSIRH